MKPVICLGLDGACWGYLNQWISQGRLPNLKRLLDNAAWGTLKSIIPPVTAPAWRCYSTGKNPGELGVFWWTGWNRAAGKLTFPDTYSFDSLDFWDYLGMSGKRVGIINMPTTYPPTAVNGVMVSGFGAPLNRNQSSLTRRLTYPDDLWLHLQEKYNYRIAISGDSLADKFKLQADVIDLMRARFALLTDLINSGKYDFLHLTIFYINTLHHFFGTDEAAACAWEYIDNFIGELMEAGCYLFIFSDHGMMSIDNSFLMNNWLIEQGWLKLKFDLGDIIRWMDDWAEKKVGYSRCFADFFGAFLPARLQNKIPGMYKFIRTNMIDQKINWRASYAVCLGDGVIYLNTDKLKGDYKKFRDELSLKLKGLALPDTDKPVISEIYTADELYKGKHARFAPDIIALPADGAEIYGGIKIGGKVFEQRARPWSSGNHPDGIFMAYGDEIAAGELNQPVRLTDIAPTIMHLMDVPIAQDMEGKALTELFRANSNVAGRQVCYQSPQEKTPGFYDDVSAKLELKESLSALGYL